MTKKTRITILSLCIILFFVVAPYIIAYSLGYRIDFEQKKLVITGGIYVKVLPQNADVIIDNKIKNKISILSPSVFVQNLLPKEHSVSIKKDGYFDYNKTLKVKEKEVEKLERVVLFKKNILFDILTGETESPFLKENPEQLFIIKNNKLYKNALNESDAILEKITDFEISDNNIIWLSTDGYLYSSTQDGKTTDQLSQVAIKINKKNSYKLDIIAGKIFLKENFNLLLFNQKIKEFEVFYNPVKNLKISPDNQKILYYNDNEILYSYLTSDNPEKIFLNRFSEKIKDCFWLNDNYLIFGLGEKIIISEIDKRGNINMVTLPQNLMPNDEMLFSYEDKKLYILTEKNDLLSSERLLP